MLTLNLRWLGLYRRYLARPPFPPARRVENCWWDYEKAALDTAYILQSDGHCVSVLIVIYWFLATLARACALFVPRLPHDSDRGASFSNFNRILSTHATTPNTSLLSNVVNPIARKGWRTS